MTMHVVINGKEVTNPAAKVGIVFSAILVAALVTASVVFILLPLVGIAVTFSLGFAAILVVASLVGVLALVLGSTLFAALFGPVELLIEKLRQRKP